MVLNTKKMKIFNLKFDVKFKNEFSKDDLTLFVIPTFVITRTEWNKEIDYSFNLVFLCYNFLLSVESKRKD
jgi:hypothetical protein